MARSERTSAFQLRPGERIAVRGVAILFTTHKMEEIRARVDTVVGDEATAAALKPWYKAFCKRP